MNSKPNKWPNGQIVYEIFPERFAIGRMHNSESKLAMDCYDSVDPPYIKKNWDDLPENPSSGWDFFGGDLYGVADRLDYLLGFGVTTIFLTPIFKSPSNHKYDTRNFFEIDAQFGGEEALVHLASQMKQRGMLLFMDIAFNHVSDMHDWFVLAKQHVEPYRSFFTFHEDGSYECWYNFRHMPELNLQNKELQEILFIGDNSVLKKYLNMGVDGFRFDTAMDVGIPIITEIRKELAHSHPNALFIGEITNFAGDWLNSEHKYHGVMNYYFQSSLISWMQGEISSEQLSQAVTDYWIGYGKLGANRSWNIVSSHDTPRLRNFIPDSEQRNLVIIAQFTLPGTPFIYYGEEIGMEGGMDPDCRRPMIWDDQRWDRNVYDLYRTLSSIRNARAELQHGHFKSIGDDTRGNAIAFMRYTDKINEYSLVIINNDSKLLQQRLFIPHSHLYHNLQLQDLLYRCPSITVQMGHIDVKIPPYSAAIYAAVPPQHKNYHYYKKRNLLAVPTSSEEI